MGKPCRGQNGIAVKWQKAMGELSGRFKKDS
jgi:hypothetical protein